MMKTFHLKSLLILLSIAVMSTSLTAQTDSTEYIVQDLVFMKDGTSILGKILSFDEESGGLVIQTKEGRTYSLSREEYEYFERDKKYPIKKKKDKVIKPRKTEGLAFHAGISAGFLSLPIDFSEDENYESAPSAIADVPVTLKIGGGKQLDRQNFVGAVAEIGLVSESSTFFNGGIRYVHQYDKASGNVGMYIPVELKYQAMKIETQYDTTDTLFSDNGQSWEYPRREDIDVSLSSVNLTLGHGFAFMLENEKSFAIEMALVKHFVLSQSFQPVFNADPNATYDAIGIRMAFLFNF